MQIDPADVCRSFPWVKELWLLAPSPGPPSRSADVVVVSSVPPKQVAPGQRRRLLAQLEEAGQRDLHLRLTTGEQLAGWLALGGAFALAFHKRAVKLFERPSGAPGEADAREN